ncbi:MAG: hypothetical protein AVDCRST_MAG14-2317 [uncultured Rubrobacteraceae bacterium]|uniref:Helix-turn-helix domain-containing protein n=1 Tax=uncultured Rubrobacteraceae bacterium TaxID=349277 RepID=A0A6J4R674_9ACTN|nr:MAG: hypothetical protein AVDCRST_MAG14-2317 [uncultured Rubrobacteraceae bacterium]
MENGRYWTIVEAAQFLNKPVSWLDYMLAEGKLDGRRYKGEWLILPQDVRKLHTQYSQQESANYQDSPEPPKKDSVSPIDKQRPKPLKKQKLSTRIRELYERIDKLNEKLLRSSGEAKRQTVKERERLREELRTLLELRSKERVDRSRRKSQIRANNKTESSHAAKARQARNVAYFELFRSKADGQSWGGPLGSKRHWWAEED